MGCGFSRKYIRLDEDTIECFFLSLHIGVVGLFVLSLYKVVLGLLCLNLYKVVVGLFVFFRCTWSSRSLSFLLFFLENALLGASLMYIVVNILLLIKNSIVCFQKRKKKFLSIFSPKFFIHHISLPNKHILRDQMGLKMVWCCCV